MPEGDTLDDRSKEQHAKVNSRGSQACDCFPTVPSTRTGSDVPRSDVSMDFLSLSYLSVVIKSFLGTRL
jgi:hypothetical protein